jgi:hypothetical protein
MKKLFVLLFALFFCVNTSFAQTATYADYFKEGNFVLLEENYDVALFNFLKAYKIDSSSANINFNVGYCLLNSSSKKALAERYLAKAVQNVSKNYKQDDASETAAPPVAYFFYGKALHINKKFDEAVVQYNYYQQNFGNDKTTIKEVEEFKKQSEYAKELTAAPLSVKVENLGDSINSIYPDFNPILSSDERMIIFTTRRNTSTGGLKTPDGQYYEDIVVAYKDDNGIWSSPKSIGGKFNKNNINTPNHDAAISLSPDGQTLIVFKGVSDSDGNIFYSTWDGEDWTSLQEFGSDINTEFWETHACLSADGNTLYFVSDRPGGYGGRDIYRCVKLPNGKWSKALNVGPTINTKDDEDGPFLHPDGLTFMFSSNGHKTMGGFDIFFSMIESDGKFSEPINMGYPINTPDDDVFFVTSPDGKRGYFSSAKEGGHGEKDIYMMTIQGVKETPLVLFKGGIIAADGEKLPEDLEIIVTNKNTGEIVGKYKPKENGGFATILAPNKNYNFSYQSKGEEFYNEDLFVPNEISYQEIKKEINLEPVSLIGKVRARDNSISLSTIVYNNINDNVPAPNSKITVVEKGGKTVTYDTDEFGKKNGIVLNRESIYTIFAESNGEKSNVISVSTKNLKGGRAMTQALYLKDVPAIASTDKNKKSSKKGNKPVITDLVDCGSPVTYKLYFGYNKDSNDETKTDWKTLINAIVSKSKGCDTTSVKIMSSASQVPTKSFNSDNKLLSASRADKMEEKIKQAVEAKGGNVAKINFIKISAVRGPAYNNDAQNVKKYNPFQYVKIIAR